MVSSEATLPETPPSKRRPTEAMRVISKTAAESMPGDTPTWASRCWAVKSAATVHATEGMATTHVATESAMTCEASVAATTGETVATVLREGRFQYVDLVEREPRHQRPRLRDS